MVRHYSAVILPLLIIAPLASADLLTLNPVADTRILGFFPDTNFGADFLLSTYHEPGNEQHTVIHFDLGTLPAGVTINDAQLRLYCSAFYGATTPTSIWAYRVTTPWLESQATWRNAAVGSPWTNVGGDFVGMGGVQMTDPYATWTGNQPGMNPIWCEMNMTDLVRQHHDGTHPNYGIGLAGPDGSQMVYVSKEGLASPDVPQLVIDYTPIPEPASGVLLSVALLITVSRRGR